MATSYLKEYLLSQLCKLGIDWPPPKEEEKPVVVQQTLTEAGYTPLLPTDEIPVALLPGMLRLDKQSWLNALSIEATFSSDVEDGDLVYPVAAGVSGEFISNIAELRDAVWKPVNQVSGTASTDEDSPRIWGIAYKHVGRVMFGPVVFHQRFAFKTGDILYVGDGGEITTTNEGAVLGVCLAPGSIFIDLSVTSSKLALDALQERVDKLEQSQKGASGSISDLTEEIKDIQSELNKKLENGDNISNSTVTASGSTTARPLKDRFADVVNAKDFGVKGDGITDDTDAIIAADTYAYENGRVLFFPAGQYAFSGGIVQKASWLGVGAPKLGPFPLLEDDKVYLSSGNKNKLPGSSLLLTSNSTLGSIQTARTDMFSSMTYAIKTNPSHPVSIKGMALVQDMTVLVGDSLTDSGYDNHVECEVGYLIDDTSRCYYEDFVVFGYWDKAGIAILSRGSGDNPDYTKFVGGSTMGYYGMALLGNNASVGSGLSGTQAFGLQIFANDHHNLERAPHSNLKSYQDNGYGHCLYIDGDTSAVIADIDGHIFFGGSLRTYSNRPVIFDHASSISLIGTVFEFPDITSQEDTLETKFIASSNTRRVGIIHCRNSSFYLFNHANFDAVVSDFIGVGLYNFASTFVCNKGRYAALRNMAVSGNPEPSLSFTNNPQISDDSSNIYRDVQSASLVLSKRADLHSVITIQNGTITPTTSYHFVLGEGGEADELVTISGNFVTGQRLVIAQKNQQQPITLKSSGGNIRFSNNSDKILGYTQASIELIYNGNFWVEASSTAFKEILRPIDDNSYSLGTASYRWSQLYAASATINTSDERSKKTIESIPDVLLDAWGAVEFRQFIFIDAFLRKGDAARTHSGLIAQQVVKAFSTYGIDATKYGLLCYDEWPEEKDKDGNVLTEAGNRYGIRYEEALCLEAAYQRRRASRLEARVAALETALQNLNLPITPAEETPNE